MNNKGFTIIELLASIVIIAIIMLIVIPKLSEDEDKKNETLYHAYEDMFEEYARFSKNKDDDYIMLGDIEELEQVKDNCTGYAVNDGSSKNYKAYISCGDNYKTDGYDENYNK